MKKSIQIAVFVVAMLLNVNGQAKDAKVAIKTAESKVTKVSTAVARGIEIAKKLDAMDDGFKNVKSNMEMVLTDRQGKTSTRVIRNQSLEVKGDGDKSLIVFEKPSTVKDTRFLSYTHKTGADEQWLYLPKLKRVKRIASENKSGPFIGSEFAFEDISSQEVEKYTYKYIRDEKLGAFNTHVIERYPVDKNSGYTKQVVWIINDDNQYRLAKIDFYDRKKALLKTLNYSGYKQYLKKFWRPNIMDMVNHVTGKKTKLVWNDYKFQTGLTSRDFDQASLKRNQ